MSDTFWVQFFALCIAFVTLVVAPIAVMYVRVKLKLDRQFKQAEEERSSVMNMVAGVTSKIVDAERNEEIRFEEMMKVQRQMLDSDVFAPGKLKALAEKKRTSGFGPLDP